MQQIPSQLERLSELFDEFGLEVQQIETEAGKELVIDEGNGFQGYGAAFLFDEAGEFVSHGIFE